MTRWTAAAVLALGAIAQAQSAPPATGIYGFTSTSEAAERQIERRFLALPSADRARDFHRYLTEEPHVAGSDRNRHLAEWMRDRWKDYGIDTVEIVEHDVLLPYPTEMQLTMGTWEARFTEDPVDGDPYTQKPLLHYNAYSASGDVEAPVVYAGSGNPRTTTGSRPGHRRARQDRAGAVLGAVQLSRLQGAHGRATRRRWPCSSTPIRQKTGSEGQGLPRWPVGQREPHPARRHRRTTSWCPAIR